MKDKNKRNKSKETIMPFELNEKLANAIYTTIAQDIKNNPKLHFVYTEEYGKTE